MKAEEYHNMYDLEFKHWWYKGLDNLLLQTLKKLDLNRNSKVLDAGCGTGRVLQKLFPHFSTYGIDFSHEALKFCNQRGLDRLSLGSLERLPYSSEQFDLVISTDVLYHLGITNDQLALSELYRVLKSGGKLILHVPALEILRGSHDKQVSTRERYTKSMLRTRVQRAGFNTIFVVYRLFFLFPLFIMARLSQKNRETKSDLSVVPGWINNMLYQIICLENRFLHLCSFPIGSSLFLIAKKNRNKNEKLL